MTVKAKACYLNVNDISLIVSMAIKPKACLLNAYDIFINKISITSKVKVY